MGLIYALIIAKVLHSTKISPIKIGRFVKKEVEFLAEFITEVLQLIYKTIEFIYDRIVLIATFINKKRNKNICPVETVVETEAETDVKTINVDGVIDINLYRRRLGKVK